MLNAAQDLAELEINCCVRGAAASDLSAMLHEEKKRKSETSSSWSVFISCKTEIKYHQHWYQSQEFSQEERQSRENRKYHYLCLFDPPGNPGKNSSGSNSFAKELSGT